MNKTLLIIGAGPGFSTGVAEKFGAEGYSVGLISRSADNLAAMCKNLEGQGINAYYSAADVSDAEKLEQAISELKTKLGGVSVLLYNVARLKVKDIFTETVEDLTEDFKLNVAHALFSVQLLHSDLKTNHGAVLLTGGGLSRYPNAQVGSLSLGKAATWSLAIQLHQRLKPEGIFAGTITISGMVAPDSPTHSPKILAEKLWQLYQNRTDAEVVH